MSTPNIRNADLSDLKEIMDIYEYARKFMKQTGNRNQWANKFPPESLIKEDIEKKQLYIIEKSGFICGVFAFIIGNDPTYSTIENGTWLSDKEYGTIHRIAGNGKVKRIFDKCMEVNKRGKAEVFFQLSPHVKQISISIHSPNWKCNKDGQRMDFYFDNLAAGESLESIEYTLDAYI